MKDDNVERFRKLLLRFLRHYKIEEDNTIVRMGGIGNFRGLDSWSEDKRKWYDQATKLLLFGKQRLGLTDKAFDQILFDEGGKFAMVVCPSFLVLTY